MTVAELATRLSEVPSNARICILTERHPGMWNLVGKLDGYNHCLVDFKHGDNFVGVDALVGIEVVR